MTTHPEDPPTSKLPVALIANVDRIHQLAMQLDRKSRQAQSRLDEVRMLREQITREIGRLAAPVPDGYVHRPGCITGAGDWHTCIPQPGSDSFQPSESDFDPLA